MTDRTSHPVPTDLSPVVEDYLKAIYALQTEQSGPVSTSDLAERLDVAAPSVSSMFDTLKQRGLIDREKHRPVSLTSTGEAVALRVVRNHRLLETFLAEQLGYDWAEVHGEADRLEHHLSARFAARLSDALDDPQTDPHGDPIPDETLAPPSTGWTSLHEADEGDRVRVRRVRAADDELRYLADRDIEPDADLTVAAVTPFGMVTVLVDGTEQSLPEEIARRISVQPLETGESVGQD